MQWIITKLRPHSSKLIVTAILVITAFSYSNIFNNAFLWDDGYFVDYKNFQNFSDIPNIIRGDQPMSYGQVYRPARNLIYLAVNQLLPSQPFGYHFVGIIAHLAITFLVFHIIKQLTDQPTTGYIGALLFGIHPIHTEAVTWITASFDTVGIAFFFVSFYSYLRYSKTNQPNWYWSYAITGWLAFFTYELTFVLLPIIIVYEIFFHLKQDIAKVVQKTKALWLALIMYSGARIVLVPDISANLTYLFGSPIAQIIFIPVLFFHYLRLLIIPYPLSINHEIYPGVTNFFHLDTLSHQSPPLHIISLDYLIPALTIITLVYLIWRLHQTNYTRISFALTWFFIGLLPVLQLIPQNSVFAERYVYISSFGIIFLMSIMLFRLIQYKPGVGKVGLIVLTLVYLLLTLQRNRDWQDMFSFWGKEARKDPPSAFVIRQLAAGHYMQKEYDTAIDWYQKSLKLYPEDPETYFKVGYLYYLQKQCDQAQEYFQKAREFNPSNLSALNFTADCYQSNKEYSKATKLYQESLKLNPNQLDIQQRLQQLNQIQSQ